jgi:hypothetical protein
MSGSSARSHSTFLAVLFLASFLLSVMQPVRAQVPLDLTKTFDYSPLVSGATNALHLVIRNTDLAPVRLLSVAIWFSWMQANTYLSAGSPQDISAQQEVRYSVSFAIPENVSAGRYSMTITLNFQRFQTAPVPHWAAPEAIVHLNTGDTGVIVFGRSSPYSIKFDPYDARAYSAIALITLIGWYLPKSLRSRVKG